MISTADYSTLPDRNRFQKICKAISVLDAIISQDWQYRYYSYNSKWSDTEEFCEMRNGEGDHILILFQTEGCVINGMAHEYHPKDKNKLTQGLPAIFREFISGEPVNSVGTTFCLWTTDNSNWQIGQIENYEDGSNELLSIFDGNPQTYIDWAIDYYEDVFSSNDKTIAAVKKIYNGETLTNEMVFSITNDLKDWDQLKSDLKEIGYNYTIE